jgi:hypothetical protein
VIDLVKESFQVYVHHPAFSELVGKFVCGSHPRE